MSSPIESVNDEIRALSPPVLWNFDARISRITTRSLLSPRSFFSWKQRDVAWYFILVVKIWKEARRARTDSSSPLLPPPPSFLPSPRVITDKRLKRELSATNIDCEDGKRRGRETESASCPATTRHDPLVRVAGKATISFQRRRAHASKGSSYVSIANELMGNHR